MTDTQIADYRAATGDARMTVTADPTGAGFYTFRITGTHTLTIADHEAISLADALIDAIESHCGEVKTR